jgi:Pathogenicity locus
MKKDTDLEIIPGVGKRVAEDLRGIGIAKPSDLKGKDPEMLYDKHNKRIGRTEDRCLLYVFRCAVYYANGGKEPYKLKWWNWSDKNMSVIS